MKALLAALNAKYIHSNLGIYCLYAYSRKQGISPEELIYKEYTINQSHEDIIANIYEEKPDIIGFSCYIWNIGDMISIGRELRKLLPDTEIWFGGPEVSYNAEQLLRENPWLTGVMAGAGEKTFYEVVMCCFGRGQEWDNIAGLIVRNGEEICRMPDRECLPMDEIPFVYDVVPVMEHHILYYETSRGCPYGCSYCLSSVDKGVCFRSMELVERELQYFLDKNVLQVKFVDRTFNCNPHHTMAIWRYIYEHDNGVTNFHFELSADILTEEEIDFVGHFRPGLVQFEIGVQSTNPKTIAAIHRKMDLDKLRSNVEQVRRGKNIHQHLDLIAGLPYESFAVFRKSFCDVYAMQPDMLQLGFLKLLKGSPMELQAEEYGIVCQSEPPYEVLYTKWISFSELRRLKRVEDMVERYYNSMQFTATVKYLVPFFEDSFAFYDSVGQFYKEKGYFECQQSRIQNYDILLEFVQDTIEKMPDCGIDVDAVRELLVFDLYARENLKSEPLKLMTEFQKSIPHERRKNFYQNEHMTGKYLSQYHEYQWKQKMRMTYLGWFSYDILKFLERGIWEDRESIILFDYAKRNPLNHQAACETVDWA